MKKFVKLFALVFAFVLSSCTDGDSLSSVVSEVNLPHVVTISSNSDVTRALDKSQPKQILAFDDESSYNDFVVYLMQKTPAQREDILVSLGFECLQTINIKADKELDEIGEKSASAEEFRTKYDAYKEKYKGVLVPNTFDSSDLSLYIPTTKNMQITPYLVGRCNQIMVGNKLRTIPFSNQMNNNDKLVFASSFPECHEENSVITRTVEKDYASEDSWPINGFKDKSGGKKTIFACSVDKNNKLAFHFGAQKKMWYGWKRDYRNFFFRIESMHGVYNINPMAVSSNLVPNTYYFGTSKSFEYIGVKDITIADVTLMPIISLKEYEITGKVFVWTDRMYEKDANNNIIYQETGDPTIPRPTIPRENFPLLKKEHSLPCKIVLTKNR